MLFSANGKSQSSLLILVSLVGIIVIIFIFYGFSSLSIQQRSLSETQLTKVTSYVDIFKGFSKQSALLASHSAAKEVAGGGGENSEGAEARTWICGNDVNPPTVNEVRYFLGDQTKGFLNNYVSQLWVEEQPDIYFSNFTCSNVDVTEQSVLSGQNDEKYNVNNFGSFVEVKLNDDTANSTNDVSVQVAQVRFWYLYRIFRQWAAQTSYTQDVMGCINEGNVMGMGITQSCDFDVPQAFRNCVESAAEKASKELESLFDSYVKCGYNFGCLCIGISQSCNLAYPCAKCNHVEANNLCSSQVISGQYQGTKHLLNKTGEQSYITKPVPISKRYLIFAADADVQWCNQFGYCGMPGDMSIWGGVSTTFSCKDTKYALSVS